MSVEEIKMKLSVDGIDETLAKLERIAELCAKISGFGMNVASCNVIDARGGADIVFTLNRYVEQDEFNECADVLCELFPDNRVHLVPEGFGEIKAIKLDTHASK